MLSRAEYNMVTDLAIKAEQDMKDVLLRTADLMPQEEQKALVAMVAMRLLIGGFSEVTSGLPDEVKAVLDAVERAARESTKRHIREAGLAR